jgi:hypothetical protein
MPLRVQVPPLLNVPAEGACVKVTVPVGVIGVLGEMSVTVAVQVDAVFTVSGDGEQEIDVELALTLVMVCASKGRTCE